MDQEIKDSQHPLDLNSPNEPLIGDEIVKKSVNSRRRRRGSRRHSSGNSDVNETTSDTEKHTQRRQSSQMEEDKDSPAFQSLVDIIHEMKRLPSISISPEKPPTPPESSNSWKRVRRHSEPQHKYKQQQHHHHDFKNPLSTVNEQQHSKHADMTQGKPVFSNSFLALELDDEGENNIDTLVSPLNKQQQRTRSKSVPDAIVPQRRDSLSSTRKVLYPAHLPIEEASVEIRAHALFSGILRVDLKDSSEANVECEELDGASIYIFGSRNRNRAFDGDEVAVRLVPVDEMMEEKISKRQRHTRRLSLNSVDTPSNVVCNPGLSSIPENDTNFLDMSNLAISDTSKPKYCGRVVSILERPKKMLFSGTLSLNRPHAKTLDNASREKKDHHGPKIIWFIPADKRLPLVAVPIKHAPTNFIKYHEEYKNRIFIGSIQRWPATSLHPFGIVEKEIGWMGELAVHSAALIADNHIRDMDFSETVQKAAAAVPSDISSEDRKNHRDLTTEDITIFTMGESDSDLNTAFSVTKTEDGILEIGIHVTDVSNYVRANTPLDREARERSCSVNLVDRKIAILPPSFTESRFSLGIDQERLAFSVLCRFTENGVLLHAWIGKTVIKSKGHVYFPSNQKLTDDLLKADSQTLLKMCRKLQQNRLQKLNGHSLARSFPIFKMADSGYPEEIDRFDGTDHDALIDELLIVANVEVAQKVSSRFPDQALLYRQNAPKLSKLAAIQDYFDNDPLSDSYNGLLKLVSERELSLEKRQALVHIIRQNTPGSIYFSAGAIDIVKFPHAGYGVSLFTVFTEPIHNYASIFVQRQLSEALKGIEQDNANFDAIDKIARHCNSTNRFKATAEQDSRKLYTAAYIYRQHLDTDQESTHVEAYVMYFGVDSIIVYIPEFDLELPIELNEISIPGGQHEYDSKMNKMNIEWSNGDKQSLKFMSSIELNISVDLKVVRPIFKAEIIKHTE
ncbi:uncharacterized protein EV154DRAFT_469247 [Mucor mucedo]|uniref:uncharacterized protein n=1 Tax=Mucor mucedo TaxID=29922 RepID=UPI00221F6D54|nr:uncharacterized protein EV154DRAFT_469247 [Mucor mucedo]KAI7888225.1 hypothetical protein EV154DRAFT_469247 [Mucor mucedo]